MALERKTKKIEKLNIENSCELDCYKEKFKLISDLVPFYLEAGIISPKIFEVIKKIETNNKLPIWITEIGSNYVVIFNTLFFVKETSNEIDVVINRNYPNKKFLIENLDNDIHNKIRKMTFKYNIINGKYLEKKEVYYEAKDCIGRRQKYR